MLDKQEKLDLPDENAIFCRLNLSPSRQNMVKNLGYVTESYKSKYTSFSFLLYGEQLLFDNFCLDNYLVFSRLCSR